MQTISRICVRTTPRAAIRWLSLGFGFVQLLSVPESGDYVRHAQLKPGKNLMMVGSVRPNDGIVSPKGLGSATEMLAVYVEDSDAHFAREQARGENILFPPANPDFGSREYQVLDLEGHPWTFGRLSFRGRRLRECENR
jgi:uncharacterized glyoxalase superfamily protein PhnB